jgi:hypothetical protein
MRERPIDRQSAGGTSQRRSAGRVSKGGRRVRHFSVAKRPVIDLFSTCSDRCSGASLVIEVSPQVERDSIRKRHRPVVPGAEDAETLVSGGADSSSVAEGPVIDLFSTCSSASSDAPGSGAVIRMERGLDIIGVPVFNWPACDRSVGHTVFPHWIMPGGD